MEGFVKVYRLEDHEGNGPYRGKTWDAGYNVPEELQERFRDYGERDPSLTKAHVVSMTLWTHNNSELHVPPLYDIPEWEELDDHRIYKFGFLLLSDLEEWFEDINEAIGDFLFVKEYWVEESSLLLGTSQVAFVASRAKKV